MLISVFFIFPTSRWPCQKVLTQILRWRGNLEPLYSQYVIYFNIFLHLKAIQRECSHVHQPTTSWGTTSKIDRQNFRLFPICPLKYPSLLSKGNKDNKLSCGPLVKHLFCVYKLRRLFRNKINCGISIFIICSIMYFLLVLTE